MKKLLLFATFIYFILATLTYHPDNKLVLTWASLNNGTVWNIWKVDTQEIAGVSQFNYPPLHFYLDKLQYFLSKPIGGDGYYQWLSGEKSDWQSKQQMTRYSLAIKTPLILFSFITSYLIFLIAKQKKFSDKQSLISAGLWLFNPITLYSIPIMGQNDVMAITFFLFAWYLLNAEKWKYSAVVFGLSASIKMFPLLWVPFLLIFEKKLSTVKKISLFLLSLFVYFLTLLPFLGNSVFRDNVLMNGIDRFFIARIDLGFNDYILIVPILLMILVVGALSKLKNLKSNSVFEKQAHVLLLTNIIFLFFNHFHPQWFLWLIPFWIFWFLQQKEQLFGTILISSLLVVISWISIILLFNDSGLVFGILTPLNQNLFVLPPLKDLLISRNIHVSLYNNYAHTLLAGVGIISLIFWFRDIGISRKEKISSILEKLYFNYNKAFLYLVLLLSSFVFIFLTALFANIIPTPLAGDSPKISNYVYFTEEVERSFVSRFNNLNRIDFKLSDNELNNFDTYSLIITDENDVEIINTSFNGLNIGYESNLRIDFPIQQESINKNYTIKLTPPLKSENPLRIATTFGNNSQQFYFRDFYQKPSGLEYLNFSIAETKKELKNVFAQNLSIYVLISVLLWFAL